MRLLNAFVNISLGRNFNLKTKELLKSLTIICGVLEGSSAIKYIYKCLQQNEWIFHNERKTTLGVRAYEINVTSRFFFF